MKLHHYLCQHSLTQKQFAELAGIKQPTICLYLKGRRFPSPKTMARIMAATNGRVTPNDFFIHPSSDGDTQPTKNPKQSL